MKSFCENCQEDTSYKRRRPKDYFGIADILLLSANVFFLSMLVSFQSFATVIITVLVLFSYVITKQESYCSKCAEQYSKNPSVEIFIVIGLLVILYYFVNMAGMLLFSLVFDGYASSGSIVDNRYFLGHGTETQRMEVSWFIYQLSLALERLHFLLGSLSLLFVLIISFTGLTKKLSDKKSH